MIQLLRSFFSMINPNLYKSYNFWEIFHVNNNKFQINDEKITVIC